MFQFDTKTSVLQEIPDDSLNQRNIRLLVKRDDLIDPLVSGNKWRKLKYILELALHQQRDGILTVGGAYSNHLLATAAVCHKAGLKSMGIVRGEELNPQSNSNLAKCAEIGMELIFISRDEYSERYEKERQEIWKQQHPGFLFVPEGGATYHGLIGCQEIWTEINEPVGHVFLAMGTGTTAAGLLLGASETTTIHIVPVVKGLHVTAELRTLLYPFFVDNELVSEYLERVVVHEDYTFGGYGKVTDELRLFSAECYEKYKLPLDSIYTAKAFYGMMKELESDRFDGKTILFLHTGGLFNSPS